MPELPSLHPHHGSKEPSPQDILIVQKFLGSKTAEKYMAAGKNGNANSESSVLDASDLEALKQDQIDRTKEASVQETKKKWMEWADEFGIDPDEINKKAVFHSDGTVVWNGDCNWNKVTELPPNLKEVTGFFYLGNLTSAERLIFPQTIGGSLLLSSLTSAEGLILPQTIGGTLYLNNLTSTEGLILPQTIKGNLDLRSLTSAEGLTLPQTIGGSLYLDGLTSAEGLTLPQTIGDDLDLGNLTSTKGLTLPQTIRGDLDLQSLTSTHNLHLPESFSGILYLSKKIKHLAFSKPGVTIKYI